MKKHIDTSLKILAGILTLTGCTSLQTTEQGAGNKGFNAEKSDGVGLHYFLPKALMKIEGKVDAAVPGGYVVTVTKSMVGDKRRQFHLRWKNNPLYDDSIATPITTNPQGLLTSVNFSATDQTPAIIGDLATTTVNVFKILGGGAQSGDGKVAAATTAPKPFSVTFDPLDTDEISVATTMMKNATGAKVQICPSGSRAQSCIGDMMGSAGDKGYVNAGIDPGTYAEDRGGVLYHPPTAVEVRFDFTDAGANIISRDTILVPDPARIACFRFGRSAFVARTTALTLTEGMPSGFTMSRTSPVKAFTGMLSTVTGTIAAAVPTIINVRTNREVAESAAEKKLLVAQTDLVNAKKAKIVADNGLAAATGQQSGPPAPPSDFIPTGPHVLDTGGQESGDANKTPGKKLKIEGTVELPAN
ncbi:MAG: hypothetical protein ABL974_19070 [Prosthecobacter sp.]